MSATRPIFPAVIPLIPQTQDFFNRVLASATFTPELLCEALAIPQKFARRTTDKNPYQDPNTGYVVEIWTKPNASDAENGITVLVDPVKDQGLLPKRLYAGENVSEFIMLYGMTCCDGASINAVLMFRDADGNIKVQHRASAEGHTNGKGYLFQGQCFVAGGDTANNLNHLWQHVRGAKHSCAGSSGFSITNLDQGAKLALG